MKTFICERCGKEAERLSLKRKYCDPCRNERNKEVLKAFRERNPKYTTNWNRNNPEKSRYFSKKSYLKHRQERLENIKLYKHSSCSDELKKRTRNLFTRAIRKGNIIRMPCTICGNEKSHGHHEDYNLPYDVIWLCAQHHKEFEYLKSIELESYTGIKREYILKTIDLAVVNYYKEMFPYRVKNNFELALLY